MSIQGNNMMYQMPNLYPNVNYNQQQQPIMAPQFATTLYIGDLDLQINEEYLYQKFCQFGQIYTLKIPKDQTKKSRGFAFVTFYNKESAEKAKQALNHQVLLINRIRVTFKKNIRDLQNDANIFVKNVPFNTNILEFDNFFNQFGKIFSSKLNIHKQDQPGYGYVQYENIESVQQCLEAQKKIKLILGGQLIECIPFEKRDNRNQTKTNIYLKNLPELPENELKNIITEKCKKFGEVFQNLLDPQIQKAFAFVCFQNPQQAEKAFDSSNQQDAIYVNWAQTRHERNKKLQDLYNQIQNETNLFIKNLKQSVTKSQLEDAFSSYGPITSCDVKLPTIIDQVKQYQSITQFGFVNFKNKDDAKNAIISSKYNQKIQELFDDPKNFFIAFHQTKNRLASFQQIRNRNQNMSQMNMSMPQMNQQYMQLMQQQFSYMQQQMGGPYGMMQGMMPIMPNMPNMPNMIPGMNGPYGMMQGMPFNNMRNQNNRGYNNNRGQRQNLPQNQKVIQKQAQQVTKQSVWTVEILKQKLQEFTEFDQDKQRMILGELLFPKIKEKLTPENQSIAPKITGMLIDFDVFEVSDIIEFLQSDSLLYERVQEAEELIKQS